MKNKILTQIAISVLLFSNETPAQVWTQLGDFPDSARVGAAFFIIGNKGYMGTGYDGTVRNDFWEYDPITDTWTQKANFGGGSRFAAGGFSIGNKGYIGLGTATYPTYTWPTDFWEYDPATNEWSQRANFPAVGRYTVASFAIGTKGYVGTGWNGALKKDFYEYDPATNLWTQRADFGGTPRQSTASFAMGSKGYIGTGHNGTQPVNDFWEYNPITNVWVQKASVGGPLRYAAAAFTLGNYAYIGLGSSSYPNLNFLNDFWRYDAVTNTWAQVANFAGVARYHVVTFSFDCSAYVALGEYGPNNPKTFKRDVWKFSIPVTSSFSTSFSSVCVGTTVSFSNSSSGADSYSWDFGDNTVSTAQNPSHTYSSPGAYQVVLTSSNSCFSASSTQIVNVISSPATPGSINGPSGGVCDATVSYSVTPVTYATSYNWFVPMGATIVSGQGTNSVNVSFINTFVSGTISVAATNSCGTSSVSSITVTSIPSQPGPITGPVSVCKNQNNVIYSITPVPGATSYTWTKPPGATFNSGQGTTSVNVRFGKKPGNITVRANNVCGSGPIRSISVTMPCRLDEAIGEEDFEVTLYPNPVTDKVNIVFYSLSGNESLRILNAVGETVVLSEIQDTKSEIDVDNLPEGIYFAEIISGEQKKILKLIKQ